MTKKVIKLSAFDCLGPGLSRDIKRLTMLIEVLLKVCSLIFLIKFSNEIRNLQMRGCGAGEI